MKSWLLRIHRWVTLVLSVPLATLIVTGLILSFEPIVTGSAAPGAITADSLNSILARHDPESKARAIFVRAYAGTVSIGGAQRGDMVHVDIASNARIDSPGAVPQLFSIARGLHEKLLLELDWLVTTATIGMILLIVIGVLMGWPRLRNSLSGWHQGTAWILLPLLVLSPLTGLLLAFGVTFASPPARPPAGGAPITLPEAVRLVGASHHLASVAWIRPRGGALLARLDDGGEMRVFTVNRDGVLPTARNWPRLIHEGNWSRTLSALINVVISVALMLLLTTGLWIWARRKLRRRPARARTPS